MKTWKTVAGIICVFLLGASAGWMVAGRYFHKCAQRPFAAHSRRSAEFIARRLSRELNLDEVQRRKTMEIVRETKQKLDAAYFQFRPQAREILMESDSEIRALLDEVQRKKYDRIVAGSRRGSEDRPQSDRGAGGRKARNACPEGGED